MHYTQFFVVSILNITFPFFTMHCADIPSTMCNCASTTSKRHTTSKSANTHYTHIQTASSAVNEFPIIVSFCPEGSPFCVGISDWLWSLGHIRHSFSHITHYSLLLTNSKKIRFMSARNKHRICSNNDNNRCRYNKKKITTKATVFCRVFPVNTMEGDKL